MYYILLLCLFIICSGVVIIFMNKFTNIKLTNLIFVIVVFGFYLTTVLYVYFDVGFYDWNFQNTLPVANVSPFMFFTIPIYFVLPKNIKKYYLTLISLLSVGMFLSPSLGCVRNAVISYRFIPLSFLFDYIAHFGLFLWGIYLVKTNQVQLKIKDCLIGGAIIVFVAILMIIINAIFDTSFFGLSLRGKHNIYNVVLVKNSYLSVFIYMVGLCGALILGFILQKFVIVPFSIKRKIKKGE